MKDRQRSPEELAVIADWEKAYEQEKLTGGGESPC